MKILVLHGVNLNMFGKRDKSQYGTITLDEINNQLFELAKQLDCEVEIFQTNEEGKMIERIHKAVDQDFKAIIINAGAWTHYNYAIADALAILKVPVIEVHMSNIFKREQFRAHSVISTIARGCICGFGSESYLLALRAAKNLGNPE